MKIKVLLIFLMIFGILSCEKNESSEIDKLTEGIWSLETTSINYETIDFKANMTYKITGFVNNPMISSGIPIETGYITGNWDFENNKITFTTAHVELNSNNSQIDIPTLDGQSIGSFYGYEVDGIYQDTSDINRIILIGGDTISMDTEYVPTIWIIEELSDNSLTVKNGAETFRYNKQ